MPRVALPSGIELDYAERGEGPALLLVMGIGAQRVHWPEGLIERLVARGLRVISYDNRDCGQSSVLDDLGTPSVPWTALRGALGAKVRPPYTLEDMAADGVGLLDALGVERAHVVGASMGGMIAFWQALSFPERVQSLTSLITSPDPRRLRGRRRDFWPLVRKPPREPKQAVLDHQVRVFREIGGPLPLDEPALRERLGLAYDRGRSLSGYARQMAAILGSPAVTPRLGELRMSTAVIQGGSDPLFPAHVGEAIAAAIPGASLRVLPDMGHMLHRETWDPIVDEVEALVARSEGAAAR
ncbi:MAG: alpha/beta hydrolase [Planctomycetes bacterium]|nr:alpha/beta hydrolase [Planctomycetota bacterium]